MNVKRILTNGLLIALIIVLLTLCVSTHIFDGWLQLIGVGVPMWVFLILILLGVNIYYQSRILKTLQSFDRQDLPYEDDAQ